jgi:hypothetical protein
MRRYEKATEMNQNYFDKVYEKTYRTLLRYVRHPEAVPAGEAAAKTVRELAARMGLDDGRLAALDADLGALAE